MAKKDGGGGPCRRSGIGVDGRFVQPSCAIETEGHTMGYEPGEIRSPRYKKKAVGQ